MYMLNPDEPGQQADTKANQRNTDYHSQEDGITRNLSPEIAHPANSSSHKRRDICNKSIHSRHLTFYKTSLLKNFFIYHHGASFRYDLLLNLYCRFTILSMKFFMTYPIVYIKAPILKLAKKTQRHISIKSIIIGITSEPTFLIPSAKSDISSIII